MIERASAATGGFDVDLQLLAHLRLTGVVGQPSWPQAGFQLRFALPGRGSGQQAIGSSLRHAGL